MEPTNPNGSGRAARPPGLTNGNGAFPSRNGRSPPNRGPAFTNGLGFVNGTRTNNHASPPPTVREVRRRRRTWKTWLPLFVAILLLAVPIAYFLTPPAEPRSVIRIDGSSSDWEHLGVPFYTDVTDSSNPDVALAAYAATRADGSLFLAARTAGIWFSDRTHASAVYFFVDTDGNASTGYRVDDLGADAQVRVLGQNGSAEGGRLTTWSGSDPLDWGNWGLSRSVAGASGGNFLETAVDVATLGLTDAYRIRVATTDFRGNETMSSISFGARFGALRVEQRPLTSSVSGANAPLLELTFTAFGGPVSLEGIAYTTNPIGLAITTYDVPTAVLPGQRATAVVSVDANTAPSGSLVSVGIASVAGDRPYTLAGPEARAYVDSRPTGKVADGIFDDWTGGDLHPDPWGDATYPSTDVTAWGTNVTTAEFLFYVRVRGSVLSGTPVVETHTFWKAGKGASSQVVPARQRSSGEDYLRVWIDRDPGARTGEGIDGIDADILLSVSGIYGRVTGTRAFTYDGTWKEEGNLQAFVGGNQAEGGFSSPLALSPQSRMVIEVTAWTATPDLAGNLSGRGTRGADADPAEARPPTWLPDATVPPDWTPRSWISMGDSTDPIADPSLDIWEVRGGNWWPSGYIYVSIVLRGNPVLANHSWWLYLDNNFPFGSHDGNNDWLVEERPGEVCTYAWDAPNSDWGVNGSACDTSDTATDTDVGSAVRVDPSCSCVEFALEKSDYPGLGQRPWVSGSSDAVEDLNLLGNTDRNPLDAPGVGCSVPAFDDCTTSFEIPEYPTVAMVIAIPGVLLGLRRGRRSGRASRDQG